LKSKSRLRVWGLCNILVSAFGVYGGYQLNPSEELAKALDGLHFNCCRVKSIVLPVSLRRAPKMLGEAFEKLKPRIAVGMGLAPRHRKVTMELAAVPVAHFPEYSDEDGVRAELEYVDEKLQALTPTIPVQEVYNICSRERGLPLTVGVSAGTYLCNIIAYTLYKLGRIHNTYTVFLHLPPSTDLALRHGISYGTPLNVQLETVNCIIDILSRKACSSTQQ
jgi:pyroglutamyl-peptidase